MAGAAPPGGAKRSGGSGAKMGAVREAVLVAIVVAAVTAVCLWFLFRDGSMAHRAERDYGDDTPGTTAGSETPTTAPPTPADDDHGLGNTDDLA